MQKVLVVEDEPAIASILRVCIEKEGHQCFIAEDGDQGWQEYGRINPDLLVLDLNLPGMNGLDLCARIRRSKLTEKEPYILMLTAQGSELDRIIGFTTGADDYIPKPFNPQEFIVRVRALFRRDLNKRITAESLIDTPHLQIDVECRHAWIKEQGQVQELKLPNTEFDLLVALAGGRAGRVWEREELIDVVWGETFLGHSQIVTSYIRRLRNKLVLPSGELLDCITTHTGIGYSFKDKED